MGVLNLPDEILPLGKVGVFEPLWIEGWDAGRSDTIDILRASQNEWTSKTLIDAIIKGYGKHAFVSSLSVKVATVDKWLVGYRACLPPHQIFMPRIGLRDDSNNFEIDKHGFIYVGQAIRRVPGYPLIDAVDFDYFAFYQQLYPDKYSMSMSDKEFEEYANEDQNTVKSLYIRKYVDTY